MINRKTPAQLDLMAAAGQVHARCMKLLASKIRPGVTTGELDNRLGHQTHRTAARACGGRMLTTARAGGPRDAWSRV